MLDSIKVSIITACFNSKETIEQTIVSVINQTYTNLEYIIIDGGSIDGTLEVIKKYQSKIAYFISEPDNGISDAWNKGLKKATGDIIGIINSDDWYEEDAVTKAVTALKDSPQAGFVFGDMNFVGPQDEIMYVQKGDPFYKNIIVKQLPSIPHPTVFVKKSVYDEFGGFDCNNHSCMDYEFLLRSTIKGTEGIYIPVIQANMRLGGESDRNYIRCYKEGMQASISYGYNPLKAKIRFYLICFKTFMRKFFQRNRLYLIIRLYRTFFNKRYRYIVKSK